MKEKRRKSDGLKVEKARATRGGGTKCHLELPSMITLLLTHTSLRQI